MFVILLHPAINNPFFTKKKYPQAQTEDTILFTALHVSKLNVVYLKTCISNGKTEHLD